ncbi:MAG: sigma-70 family RNA polymerase sigma factor [Ginsengibacter sp.]
MNAASQIWDNLKSGNKSALKELYDLYRTDLVRYGNKINPDEQLIEDAIQETFISIWKYRNSVSMPLSVKNYMIKAFRNHLINIIQSRSNTTYTEESIHFSFEIGFDDKIIENEDAGILSAKINSAITKLSNRQREIIYYRFYENLSFEEIGELMEMQTRATYKLMARAISSLKDILGKNVFNLLFL